MKYSMERKLWFVNLDQTLKFILPKLHGLLNLEINLSIWLLYFIVTYHRITKWSNKYFQMSCNIELIRNNPKCLDSIKVNKRTSEYIFFLLWNSSISIGNVRNQLNQSRMMDGSKLRSYVPSQMQYRRLDIMDVQCWSVVSTENPKNIIR